MVVSDIMSHAVASISPNAPLSNVVNSMNQNKRSCMVVVKRGELVGIITERDIVRVMVKTINDDSFVDCPVSEVMTIEPIYVTVDTSLPEALAISKSHRLRHLPVINKEGSPVGIVTQTDIANASIKLITENSEMEGRIDALQALCMEDALLGIGNRRSMEVDLHFVDSFSKRHEKSYCVGLLDIDHFKNFNDLYGHQAGDKALQVVSNTLNAEKRDSDRLYRYGGEEFLLLMPNTEIEGAYNGIERLREEVKSLSYEHKGCPKGYLTVSVGIADSADRRWQDVVKAADEAMYEAKKLGRNRTEYKKPA